MYDCITSFLSLAFTLRNDRLMLSFETESTLQTILFLGTTYCRMNFIRPGAISDEMIVPFVPSGK